MRTRNHSIQQKLMRMILFICGAVLFVACVSFFIYDYVTYRNLTRQELVTLGQITASNTTSSLAFVNKEDAQELLSALKAQKHIVVAALYDTEGNLFVTYPDTVKKKDLPSEWKQSGYHFTNEFLEGYEPVVQGDRQLGTLYLKSDMKAVYNRFELYGTLTVLFFAISFFFTYLLSRRMQRSVTEPILELANKAKLVSDKKDYSVRADKKSNDELGTLTDAFNHMLTQIERQNGEISVLNANLEEKIVQRTKELQEANNALTEQNEFIQTIIDASIDLIAVFDKDLNIVVVNQYAARIYNKKREELVGKTLVQVFPDLEGKPVLEHFKRALQGEFHHVEAYQSQLTEAIFENFYIPLRNHDNTVDRVLLIGHDITGIIKTNQKLQQLNRELEKSNRDLEQFAYVASHDLQEPLRKILTFSDLSEQNSHNPEIQKRYLQKISSSANRMTQLIKAVLNYSRLSSAGTALSEVNLNDVVEQIKTDLELVIEEKGAVVETNELPVIKGDPLQLSQLFLNLFTNSLKFTEKAPHITIQLMEAAAAETAGFMMQKDQHFFKIVFSDNGIGFEQKYAERVFSIFQRLHSSDQFAGTGIGLALCKKIVENHGGFITVVSERAKGTSFSIFLPYTKALNEKAQPETVEANQAAG